MKLNNLMNNSTIKEKMEKNKVTTLEGEVCDLSDCYFIKERSGYLHKSSSLLVFDHYTKEPKCSRDCMSFVLNPKEATNRTAKRGYTTKSESESCLVSFQNSSFSGDTTLEIMEQCLDFFVESPKDGLFIEKKNFKEDNNIKYQYHRFNNIYEFNPKDIVKSTKFGTFSPTFRITEGKKYTFGVELETSIGRLFRHDYYDLNVQSVHDGSLRGPNGEDPTGGEYVTGVLTGDMGFNQINKLCSVLSKKCEIDKRCGVHVHVGITPTKEFIVKLYMLLQQIEPEMWTIIPPKRRGSTYCQSLKIFNFNKLKDCAKLSQNNKELLIDEFYSYIYKYVHREPIKKDENGNEIYVKTVHPLGDKCGFKHDTPRYCWVNFVPALFIRESYFRNKKDAKNYNNYTIEFRPHPGSLNYTKIKNWIKICMAFVYFAENYGDNMFNEHLTLEKIINFAYPKSANKLMDYINQRKKLFSTSKFAEDFNSDYNETAKKTIKEII